MALLVLNTASSSAKLAGSTAPLLSRPQTASPATAPTSTADYFVQLSARAALQAAAADDTASPETVANLERQYAKALGGWRNDGLITGVPAPQSSDAAALTRNSLLLQAGTAQASTLPPSVLSSLLRG